MQGSSSCNLLAQVKASLRQLEREQASLDCLLQTPPSAEYAIPTQYVPLEEHGERAGPVESPGGCSARARASAYLHGDKMHETPPLPLSDNALC